MWVQYAEEEGLFHRRSHVCCLQVVNSCRFDSKVSSSFLLQTFRQFSWLFLLTSSKSLTFNAFMLSRDMHPFFTCWSDQHSERHMPCCLLKSDTRQEEINVEITSGVDLLDFPDENTEEFAVNSSSQMQNELNSCPRSYCDTVCFSCVEDFRSIWETMLQIVCVV